MWWVLSAFAQDVPEGPTAARQCADAAAGSEVEVCLALVAEHPDQIDGIAAALRAHVDRAGGQDRELVQALLLLQSDRGDEGARRLGELGDPRVIAPLAFAAHSRDARIGAAAATALGAHPAAIDSLVGIVDDGQTATEVRVAAAESLGRIGEARAADALVASMRRKRVPVALKQRIADVIRERWPDRAPEIDATPVTNGGPWLAAGAGVGLGYALEAVGYAGRVPALAPVGAVSGGVAGVTAGYLAGRAWPIEAGDAAMITTSGLSGLTAGHLIGAASAENNESKRRIGGLVGAAIGYGTAIGARRTYDGEPVDAVEAQLLGAATAITAGSFAGFAKDNSFRASFRDSHGPRLATGLGLAVGTAAGHLVAPHVTLREGDVALVGMTTVYGAAFGALLPLDTQDVSLGWLPVGTAGLGALTGYGLAAIVDPRPKIGTMGTLGFASGAGTVGGLVMLAGGDGDERILRGSMLVGGTAGLAIGAWTAWRNPEPLQAEDGLLVGAGSAWALWQAVGWSAAAKAPYPTTTGLTLLAPSAAGAVLALATPALDAPVPATLAATSLGLWGGYVALVGAEVAGVDPLAPALIGSDVGLGIGILAMSPLLSAPPLAIALADAGGVLGGSLSALGASFATNDPQTILAVSLGGAGLGFTGGAIAGSYLSRHTRDSARLRLPKVRGEARWAIAPAVYPDDDDVAWGGQLSVTRW